MTRTDVPIWVDLTSPDVAASADFYSKVLGWEVEISPDPQYGGYATARVGGASVAGIAAQMDPSNFIVWHLYIGTDDPAALAEKVAAAGGTVVVPGFDIGDQGTMAVYQDPAGAFISAWKPGAMEGFTGQGAGAYGWAELNARGLQRALPFYEQVFGWTARTSPMGEGQPDYTEFRRGEQSVAGAWEMNPAIPAEVPSYWMVYFSVEDVEAAFATAIAAGATEMVGPTSFPGGTFAIITDPQGAVVGLLKTN